MDIGSITWTVEANTSKLDNARDDMDRVGNEAKKTGRDAKKMGDDIKKAGDKSKRATDKMERGFKNSSTAAKTLSRAITTVIAALSVRELVNYADAYTSINNKLKVVTKSTAELADVQSKLLSLSNETRSDLDATATLYSRMARSTEELGITQSQLLRITETINKSFAISGATASETAGAIRQLSQGFASGVLRGEEFNSVAEGAPEILRAVAKETGKAYGELREFAATGGITSALLIRSLENYGDTVDSVFAKSKATTEQYFQIAKNNATVFIGQSKSIESATQTLGQSVVLLSENLKTLSDVMLLTGTIATSRFAAPIVSAYSSMAIAQAAYISASLKGNVVTLNSAKAELGKATALKASAAASLASAKATLTNTSAEVANWKAVVQSIQAEIQLESIRLKAQISAQGRAASINRLATARLELAAATKALSGAEATNAASMAAVSKASTVATAAQTRLAAATTSAGFAARAAAGAMATLRGAMAFLGGPLGVILTAATALYIFSQRADEAADSTRKMINEMSRADAIKATRERIAELTEQVEKYNSKAGRGRSKNAFAIQAKEANKELEKQKELLKELLARPDETKKPTHPAIPVDDEAKKAYDKAFSSVKDLNLELIYQTEMLGMTDAEMLKYRLTVGDLSDEIELLGDVGINYRDSILKQAQALDAAKLAQEAETKAKEEAKSILDDLKTPMDDYIERLKKITELEQLGELTAEQASKARDKARGDFEKGQQETADKVTDFWKTATENIQNELADNLFDFMQGEFDFSADGFKRMLDRMVADALAADIAGALFPSSLGGEGGGSGLLGDLFNFASSSTANTEQFGGEFAPQSSTTDFFGSIADFFTSFDGGGYSGDGSRSGGMDGKGGFPAMLHPQETVIDHTKGGGGVVVNINVSGVTDEGGLKKTAAQIAQQAGLASQRALTRNG